MKKRLLVRGPALSQSGYGEQTRFALRSLRKYEDVIDIYLVNVGWGQTGWISCLGEERDWIDSLIIKTHGYIQACQQMGHQLQFDISLQITIPNEYEKLAPVNIGYTAGIETDKISPGWIEKSFLMDRIIVVSNHAKSGFDNTITRAKDSQTGEIIDVKCERPLYVVNYPVRKIEEAENFKLELENEFNFLVIAQHSPRKNLENTIRWFLEEFKDDKVGLVLKISNRCNSIMDRTFTEKTLKTLLRDYSNRKCDVYLLHGDMTDQEMTSLYRHSNIKALISLAHGEGFGLPLFEAAYNELPLICTTWSGQSDFIHVPIKEKNGKIKNKPLIAKVDHDIAEIQPQAVWNGVLEKGTNWAFPKQASYKSKLREVYKDYTRFKSQAKKLARHIKENFIEDQQYKKFVEAVLGEQITLFNVDNLPKISLYTSVYNGADTIEGFIKDIVNQTIFDKKVELILIHPKTSPGYEEEKRIINKYMKEHNNIVYKVLEEDPGTYACWNIGIKLATGEYCTNANLDDRRSKNYLEKFAKELYLNSDIDLIYSDALITDNYNETLENNTSNGRRYNFPEFSFENLKMVNMPHACPLYRKSLHDKYGYFREDLRSASDWEFHLRCSSHGSKMKKIQDISYLYCFNPTGISTNPSNFGWKMKEEREVFNTYKDKKVEE
jgi:hypothetical protein